MASKHRVTVGEELRYDSDLQGLKNLNGTYGRLTEVFKGASVDIAGADPAYPGYPGVSPPGRAVVNDSRAAIQAALNNAVAQGDPSSTSHYKYLRNAPTKVVLPPGNYYIGLANSQGTVPSLVVPPTVQFDYSRANLYFEVPKTSTYAWCGIQVGNYAHLKRGNTYVAPARADGTANTWPNAVPFYDACRVVFTDAGTTVDDTSAIINGFQGAAVGLFGAFITGIIGGQIRGCTFDVRASNVYATNPFGLTIPAESDAPSSSAYRMTTDVYVWGKRHSIKCGWGGYAGVFTGQTGSELTVDLTNYNQQVFFRDWIVEDTYGPAWLVCSASVAAFAACAAEEAGGTPGTDNAGFRPVIRIDNVNQLLIDGGFRFDAMGNVGTYPGPNATSGTANPNTLLHVTSTANVLIEGVRAHQLSISRTRTLAAAASIGDSILSLTSPPATAQQFVTDNGSGESVIIDSWTGSGPYTANLRSPLTQNHASGSTLLGSSMTLIEGTPSRSLQINMGIHASPYDFVFGNGYFGVGAKTFSARYDNPTVFYGTSGGTRFLWVDASGNLRHKSTAPTSDTDGAAILGVGTTAGTVAAGDDTRITGAAKKTDPLGWGIATNIGPVTVASASTTFPAANRVNYYRLVDGGTPISKARIRIGTQSGNVAVAYYANSGSGTAAVPGTLLASSGIVACGSAGSDQDLPLSATITPSAGDWVAIWADNATVAIFGTSTSSVASTLYGGRAYLQDSATTGPPVTPSSLTTGVGRVFDIVGVP